jgi:hypothetical protein
MDPRSEGWISLGRIGRLARAIRRAASASSAARKGLQGVVVRLNHHDLLWARFVHSRPLETKMFGVEPLDCNWVFAMQCDVKKLCSCITVTLYLIL